MRLTSLVQLAFRSLVFRRVSVALTIISIAVSVALLVAVEMVRLSAREGFTATISGTDLIVGARGAPVQLLLYSVFRLGDGTNNIAWSSFKEVRDDPRVAWSIPLSLGDSHRGYRVVGSTSAYFQHYQYGNATSLSFVEGSAFIDTYSAVLGSDVARELGYAVGDTITLTHGIGDTGFVTHDDHPFTVRGILERTGTPVDRGIHVPLGGISAMHGEDPDAPPDSLTAALVGLKSKIDVLRLQRELNEYVGEPLTAILPGVTLHQLWSLVRSVELALRAISICVVVAGLLGMLSAIMMGLHSRRREMVILRSLGARPLDLAFLLIGESMLMSIGGTILGAAAALALALVVAPMLGSLLGLHAGLVVPWGFVLTVSGVLVLASGSFALWPARRVAKGAVGHRLSVQE